VVTNWVPIKPIFSANQFFCWAHVDSFLTLTFLSMPKPLMFWAHADTSKSEWEHWPQVITFFKFDVGVAHKRHQQL